MDMVRTQINLPDDLLREIDRAVGRKHRSAFFTHIAREALQQPSELLRMSGADRADILAARKSLRSKTRIPWSVVKQNRKTG